MTIGYKKSLTFSIRYSDSKGCLDVLKIAAFPAFRDAKGRHLGQGLLRGFHTEVANASKGSTDHVAREVKKVVDDGADFGELVAESRDEEAPFATQVLRKVNGALRENHGLTLFDFVCDKSNLVILDLSHQERTLGDVGELGGAKVNVRKDKAARLDGCDAQ